MPEQRNIDDIGRLVQDSIGPVMAIVRGWFSDHEYGPTNTILLKRVGLDRDEEKEEKKKTLVELGAGAEPLFEQLEIFLAERFGAFLARDRQTSLDTAARLLQARTISTLKQHRDLESYGIEAMDTLAQLHSELRTRERAWMMERARPGRPDHEEIKSLGKRFQKGALSWNRERDLVLEAPNVLLLTFKGILESGVEATERMLQAMERGIRDGINAGHAPLSTVPIEDGSRGNSIQTLSVDQAVGQGRAAAR